MLNYDLKGEFIVEPKLGSLGLARINAFSFQVRDIRLVTEKSFSSHFFQYKRKPLIWFWNEAFKRGLKQNCWIHGTFSSRPISTLKRWFRPPSPPPPVRRDLTEGTACRLWGSQSCQKSVIHFETVCTSDLSGYNTANNNSQIP